MEKLIEGGKEMEDFVTGPVYLIVTHNKHFGGRIKEESPDKLVECVEYAQLMDNKGQIIILSFILGTVCIPDDALKVVLSKESTYYESYIKTTSGIVVGGKLAKLH